MSVDATATRYRVKNKNIGAAAEEAFAATAERLGLTVNELGDRVVPWLGFEPGQPRVIEPEGKRIEVVIGPDFKLKYRDVEKNKAVASLPKSLAKETLAEFKEMGGRSRGGQGAEAPVGDADGAAVPLAGAAVAGAVPGPSGAVSADRDPAGLGALRRGRPSARHLPCAGGSYAHRRH